MKADPIIFIHTGRQRHLEIAIEHLTRNNKESELILLGDESNKDIDAVSHHLVKDYFSSAQEFEDINYIHMSKNTYQFELFCYQRWFVLQEFAEKNNIEYFWYLDSDFLVFDNLTDYLMEQVGDPTVDVVGFDSTKSGAGDSFMPCFNRMSLRAVKEITRFFVKSYEDKEILSKLRAKWKNHHINKLAGGICDMTQLKLFFDSYNTSLSVFHSYDLNLDSIPDGNINSGLNYFQNGERFKTYLGMKYVEVKDNKAFGFLENGNQVRFVGSHFQGRAKRKMFHYSKENYTPKNFSNIASSLFGNQYKKLRMSMIKKAKRIMAG